MIPYNKLTPFYGLEPITDITPFTKRAGDTYLTILEKLSKYVDYIAQSIDGLDEKIVDAVNAEIEQMKLDVAESIAAGQALTDEKLEAFSVQMGDLVSYINNQLSDALARVDKAVEDVIDSSITVQDPVVAGLVNSESETRSALDSRYLTKGNAVSSVNGRKGDVTLTPTDIGAKNTGDNVPIRVGGRLPNLTTVEPDDAATKRYVDNSILATAEGIPLSIAERTPPSLSVSNMLPIVKFPARDTGAGPWPQGFDINEEKREAYVGLVDGSTMRIDIRDLDTGVFKSSKSLTIESGAFPQSLSHYYNSSGQLCFVLFAENPDGAAVSSRYSIYNYATGTLSPKTTIIGKSHGCRDGDYYITAHMNAFETFTFATYTWQSIINGNPVLVGEEVVGNAGPTNGKTQGIAAARGDRFVVMGAQGELPSVTSYAAGGVVVRKDKWGYSEFAKPINAKWPGLLPSSGQYGYECEGGTSSHGFVYTLHIVNAPGGVAECIIMKHGDPRGVWITPEVGVESGKWKLIDSAKFGANFIPRPEDPPRIRVHNGRVEYAGSVGFVDSTASKAGEWHPMIRLVDDLYYHRPRTRYGAKRTVTVSVGGGTTAVRSVDYDGGILRYWTSAATATWINLDSLSYSIV